MSLGKAAKMALLDRLERHQIHNSDQAVSQASARTRAGRWRKGVSGNPKGGALGKISEAEQEVQRVDLYAAIIADTRRPTNGPRRSPCRRSKSPAGSRQHQQG